MILKRWFGLDEVRVVLKFYKIKMQPNSLLNCYPSCSIAKNEVFNVSKTINISFSLEKLCRKTLYN